MFIVDQERYSTIGYDILEARMLLSDVTSLLLPFASHGAGMNTDNSNKKSFLECHQPISTYVSLSCELKRGGKTTGTGTGTGTGRGTDG